MNIEAVTFQVFWVPDGAASDKADAAAWIELPNEIPAFGSKEFKEMTIKMYFRKSFFQQSYDRTAMVVAHELSHIVLESIRHPLKKCEKAVDLTAMLLGFSRIYELACHKELRAGNTINISALGYLTQAEVAHAARLLAGQQPQGKTARAPAIFAGVAPLVIVAAVSVIFYLNGGFRSLQTSSTNNSLPYISTGGVNTEANFRTIPQPPAPSDRSAHFQDQPASTTTALFNETLQIQTHLVQRGYLNDRPDGVWGPRSRNALRAFKAANGLPVDDFWDEQTMSLLSSSSAAYAPAPISPKN
jgi:Putative peptidoglycan binding domain